MSKIVEIQAWDENGNRQVNTYDFSKNPDVFGNAGADMARRINVLTTSGYVRTFVGTTGDVHIIEYTRKEEYCVRNNKVADLIEKGLTYPQARRYAMHKDGKTLNEIADIECVGITTVQDSVNLAKDKVIPLRKTVYSLYIRSESECATYKEHASGESLDMIKAAAFHKIYEIDESGEKVFIMITSQSYERAETMNGYIAAGGPVNMLAHWGREPALTPEEVYRNVSELKAAKKG